MGFEVRIHRKATAYTYSSCAFRVTLLLPASGVVQSTYGQSICSSIFFLKDQLMKSLAKLLSIGFVAVALPGLAMAADYTYQTQTTIASGSCPDKHNSSTTVRFQLNQASGSGKRCVYFSGAHPTCGRLTCAGQDVVKSAKVTYTGSTTYSSVSAKILDDKAGTYNATLYAYKTATTSGSGAAFKTGIYLVNGSTVSVSQNPTKGVRFAVSVNAE
jgi:hypothetical protein